MSPKASIEPTASFNPELKSWLISGKQQTVESLVVFLQRQAKARRMSSYGIARFTGLTIGAVKHFFCGYASAGPAARELVRDPSGVGRVKLGTFLAIVHALGYDIELVVREVPGRDEEKR